jgi:isopentenyl diphosphate isomerase/L-lactate dehydrogenase-like FMN-dependent dehydrogenase
MVAESGSAKTSLVKRILPSRDQSIANVMKGMFHAGQNWDDLRRIRDLWDGPLVLKGVMCAEDARLAADAGCEGVIISNHGGRQLDGLPATIDVLPEVVAEVGDQIEVLLDSGIRRGADVVKALALGARACLIGRPWVFGMSNGGPAGVERVLRSLGDEIDRVMALVGAASLDDLTPDVLRRREGSGWH